MNRKVRCNLCGKELNIFDTIENYSITKKIGYGSIHDGESLDLHICCECMDAIISQCVVDPVEE